MYNVAPIFLVAKHKILQFQTELIDRLATGTGYKGIPSSLYLGVPHMQEDSQNLLCLAKTKTRGQTTCYTFPIVSLTYSAAIQLHMCTQNYMTVVFRCIWIIDLQLKVAKFQSARQIECTMSQMQHVLRCVQILDQHSTKVAKSTQLGLHGMFCG